jgi:indole-3-glycerol phosphate synthase
MMLAEILRRTEQRVQALSVPEDVFRYGEIRSLKKAILDTREKNAVIAELKYASPSRGIIRDLPEPATLAADLVSAGGIAVSVLTEPHFFRGNPASIAEVREAVRVPVLRKDFIIDERQLLESKMLGADAVLLIAAVLQDRLAAFIQKSREIGIETLVETHTAEEIRQAHAAGAGIIGINNRDLHTMKTSLLTTVYLSEVARRQESVIVSESGLTWPCDIRSLRRYCDAFLIGSAITASGNPKKKLEEFVFA